jgi:hypothetical protein
MGDMRKIFIGNMKIRDSAKDLGVDGEIILE